MRPKLAINIAETEQLTALMNAALDGDTNEVRALLRLGADINTQDGKGRTALMLAVINRRVETVKALLNGGGDMNIKANDGTTVLSIAASSGDGVMMQLLMGHCVRTRAESVPATPMMMWEAKRRYAGIIKLFKKVGAVKWIT